MHIIRSIVRLANRLRPEHPDVADALIRHAAFETRHFYGIPASPRGSRGPETSVRKSGAGIHAGAFLARLPDRFRDLVRREVRAHALQVPALLIEPQITIKPRFGSSKTGFSFAPKSERAIEIIKVLSAAIRLTQCQIVSASEIKTAVAMSASGRSLIA